MVEAAVRKPRVPMAEAIYMDLRGVWRWSRLARYGRLPVLRALKVNATIKLASKMQSKLEMGRNRNQQERIEPEPESKK